MPDEPLLTPKEIAKLFGCHIKTVYRWLDERRLPYLCIAGHLYIRRRDFARFLRAGYVAALPAASLPVSVSASFSVTR